MTHLDIANYALTLLGEEGTITSLTANNQTSRVVNRVIRQAVESVSREDEWTKLIKQAVLAPDATAPDETFGYSNRFPLPVDFIRVQRIVNHEDYKIMQNYLHLNDDTAYLEYVAHPAEADYPTLCPIYKEAIAYKLAALISLPITGNQKYFETLTRMYELYRARARATSPSDNGRESMTFNKHVADRYSNYPVS